MTEYQAKDPDSLAALHRADQSHAEADPITDGFRDTPIMKQPPADADPARYPAFGHVGTPPIDVTILNPGDRLGAYVVKQELGEGGMGKVYMAQREDDFEMKVAIKVVRSNDPDIVRRFHKERRILARINFPDTARMLDGGLLPSGNPYLIMEYIEGQELDHYCDTRKLSLDERLKLFLSICDIVSLAHRSLIIHRDLKPANILVTDAGRPKLLDFGIAALMDEETGLQEATTVWAPKAMTPQYASPEQLRGEVLTAATDVYSMGVILYEMLTGRRPFSMTGNDPMLLYHQVMDKPPSRPSSVFKSRRRPGSAQASRTVTTAIDQLSAVRGEEPRRLAKLLDGDLDSIVLKALEKDPRQRYSSVESFARDIHRYLTGRPVSARSGTNRYLAVKWLQRNRAPVLVGAFVFLMLLSVAVWSTYQMKQTEKERDRAETAKRLAEKERAAAEEVSAFTVGLFSESDPEAVLTGQMSVAELVNQGTAKVRQSLHRDPESRARLMMVLGQVHNAIGSVETAEALLSESLAYFRQKGQPDQKAEVLCSMGALLRQKSDYAKAREYYQEALALQQEGGLSPRFQETVAKGLMSFYMDNNEYGPAYDALRMLDDTYCTHWQTFGEKERLTLLHAYGNYFVATGDFKTAEEYLTHAMEGYANLGEEHQAQFIEVSGSMAYAMEAQRRYPEAVAYREQIIEYNQRIYGDDSLPYAFALRNAVQPNAMMSKAEKALDYALWSLAIFEMKLGTTKETLTATSVLGYAYFNMNETALALECIRKCLSISIAINGEEAEDTAIYLHNLGATLVTQKDYANARIYLERSLKVMKVVYGGEHPKMVTILGHYIETYLCDGAYEKALDLCLEQERLIGQFKMEGGYEKYLNEVRKILLWSILGEHQKSQALIDHYLTADKYKDLKSRSIATYSELQFLKAHVSFGLAQKDEARIHLDEAWPFYANHQFQYYQRPILDQMILMCDALGYPERSALLRTKQH